MSMTRMRALVLSVAWVFACSSCTASDVPLHPHFESILLIGWWYPVSLVTDEEKVDLSVVGRIIMPLADGDLDFDFEYAKNGECYLSVNTFRHTMLPGKFKSKEGYILHIVDTDYDNYNILHMDVKGSKVLYLDAREPKVSVAVRRRFRDIASSLGFPVDKILNVPPNGAPCASDTQECMGHGVLHGQTCHWLDIQSYNVIIHDTEGLPINSVVP